jgi:peptidoglycan/xylan/chitin deacetylase (PgdA/CDA1 family)
MKKIFTSSLGKLAGAYLSVTGKYIRNTYLRILVYHRITDQRKEDFPFNSDLRSSSPKLVKLEMSFCIRYFSPITFSFFKECLDYGVDLPPRPIIITFDDGYRDNYIYAFPVLRKFRIWATFFISTGLRSPAVILQGCLFVFM